MHALLPHAEKTAALLKARNETIAVAESSAGGLITAALLAVPGASAYCIGGAVIYTRKALTELMSIAPGDIAADLKPGSEEFALLKARLVRQRLSTTWGLSENGVAGPTANRYGFAPGRVCVAVSGPVERAKTIDTGSADRVGNMYAFAAAALELLVAALEER